MSVKALRTGYILISYRILRGIQETWTYKLVCPQKSRRLKSSPLVQTGGTHEEIEVHLGADRSDFAGGSVRAKAQAQLCRDHGISVNRFYVWKRKYSAWRRTTFANLADAPLKLTIWRRFYNEERPHPSRGYRRPREVRQAFQKATMTQEPLHLWVSLKKGAGQGIGDPKETIDYDSGWYSAGEAIRTIHSAAYGRAGGFKAGAKVVGKEMSHFVPTKTINRVAQALEKVIPGASKVVRKLDISRLNVDYVSKKFHHATDYHRRMKGMQARQGMAPEGIAQLLRVPKTPARAVLGGGAARAHSILGKKRD